MNKNRLLSDNKSDSNAGASSTSQPTPQSVVIPSDLPNQSDRKHVVEWEWHGPTFAGVYTGLLDLTGNPDGTGTLRIEDGSIYDGDWQRGLRHGHGVYASVEGDLFRGTWQDDKFYGRGVYVWPDGQVYTGDYVDGLREGKGIETWPHGAKYEGEYHQDQRNGRGAYNYPDGRRYEGEYQADRPHGIGRQIAADGSVLYDGQWNMGEFIDNMGEFIGSA